MASEPLLDKPLSSRLSDGVGGDTVGAGVLTEDSGEQADKNLAPLHYAAWYNRLDAVTALLQQGAGNSPSFCHRYLLDTVK